MNFTNMDIKIILIPGSSDGFLCGICNGRETGYGRHRVESALFHPEPGNGFIRSVL